MKKDKLGVKAVASTAIKRKEVQGPQVQLQSHDRRLRLKEVYIAKPWGRGAPPTSRPSLLSGLQSSGSLTGCQNPMKVKSLLPETGFTSGCLQTSAPSETLGAIPVSRGLIVSIVW